MRTRAAVIAAIAGLSATASISMADISVNIVTLTMRNAETGELLGQHAFARDAGPIDPSASYTWDLPAVPGQTWFDNNTPDNTEDDWGWSGGELHINHDPVVNLTFQGSAGATNTLFTIDSALLVFSTIGDLEARAQASLTVTESFLFADSSATVTGGFVGGTKAFQARIDNGAFTYASLIDSAVMPVVGSAVFSGDTGPFLLPVVGYSTATSMSTHFSFVLSARDRVSGVSTFELIPAPGSAALLALGGLVAGRRRR